MIPFVPLIPSDHGSETVVYDTTTLPLYLKTTEKQFAVAFPARRGRLAMYLNVFPAQTGVYAGPLP